MNKLIRKRFITLVVAVVMAVVSFFNAFLAFEKFWELDNIIFTTRNYTEFGDTRSVYMVLTIIFFIMGYCLSYMVVTHRGKIYDILFRRKKRAKRSK